MKDEVVPYSREDFYDLLHRREVLMRSAAPAPVGARVALLTEDIEQEFLFSSSSSSSDDELRTSIGRLSRPGVRPTMLRHHTAGADDNMDTLKASHATLREFYEALASRRPGQHTADSVSMRRSTGTLALGSPHVSLGGKDGHAAYMTSTWSPSASTVEAPSTDGHLTRRYTPTTPTATLLALRSSRDAQAAADRWQRSSQGKAYGWSGNGARGVRHRHLVASPGSEAGLQARQTLLERLTAAAETRDVVCSSCMKHVAPSHRPHTASPRSSSATAQHRRPGTASTWSMASARHLRPGTASTADLTWHHKSMNNHPRPSSGRSRTAPRRRPNPAQPPPEFLQGWLLRRSAGRKTGDVATFIGDSWSELRASSMSPHRAYSVRYPGPDAATKAGSGANVTRESLTDALSEAREYTGPLLPHQAAIEDFYCRGRADGWDGGKGSGHGSSGGVEVLRRSLEAQLQKVRMQSSRGY